MKPALWQGGVATREAEGLFLLHREQAYSLQVWLVDSDDLEPAGRDSCSRHEMTGRKGSDSARGRLTGAGPCQDPPASIRFTSSISARPVCMPGRPPHRVRHIQ